MITMIYRRRRRVDLRRRVRALALTTRPPLVMR